MISSKNKLLLHLLCLHRNFREAFHILRSKNKTKRDKQEQEKQCAISKNSTSCS